MSTHNTSVCGKMRKMSIFFIKKLTYPSSMTKKYIQFTSVNVFCSHKTLLYNGNFPLLRLN